MLCCSGGDLWRIWFQSEQFYVGCSLCYLLLQSTKTEIHLVCIYTYYTIILVVYYVVFFSRSDAEYCLLYLNISTCVIIKRVAGWHVVLLIWFVMHTDEDWECATVFKNVLDGPCKTVVRAQNCKTWLVTDGAAQAMQIHCDNSYQAARQQEELHAFTSSNDFRSTVHRDKMQVLWQLCKFIHCYSLCICVWHVMHKLHS